VAADGRFLMVKAEPKETPQSNETRIIHLQNWTQELRRLMPVR
jgi:hypothetical protein